MHPCRTTKRCSLSGEPGVDTDQGPLLECRICATVDDGAAGDGGHGVVVQAEMVAGGYGRLIIIDHGGGYQTYYAHLSKISVRAGQEVHSGEVIGAVGTSGRVTAPHLHYEVRVGGTPMNPYRFLANSNVYRQVPKDFAFQ